MPKCLQLSSQDRLKVWGRKYKYPHFTDKEIGIKWFEQGPTGSLWEQQELNPAPDSPAVHPSWYLNCAKTSKSTLWVWSSFCELKTLPLGVKQLPCKNLDHRIKLFKPCKYQINVMCEQNGSETGTLLILVITVHIYPNKDGSDTLKKKMDMNIIYYTLSAYSWTSSLN